MAKTENCKKFAVVLCCNQAWLPMAAATFRFCQQQQVSEIADFFLITHDVGEAELKTFQAFINQHKIRVDIHNVDPSTALKQIKAGRFSTATLLRLMLDTIIPNTYQRLLYLDCDILPLAPLNDVFSFNMNNKPIAAVEDYVSLPGWARLVSDHPRNIGMRPESRYFNAGVILFDWPKTLEERWLHKARQIIAEAQNTNRKLPFLDQDVLNLSFENNWQAMPSRFNLMTFMLGHSKGTPVLRHFNSKHKPWGKTWIPGLAKSKMEYLGVFSGTSYSTTCKSKFRRISLPEIGEYLVRRMAVRFGLRSLDSD